ncbi:MAG: hypothetical protein Q4C54_08270 [Clostridia bacterium]|nr:hypothetical protein [Clostridia bacterium]
MKTKGRISGLLCMILTVAYAIYIVAYFGNASTTNLGGAIATALVVPHMICVAVAAVFSLVGFFVKKRWAMLTCAILMAVAAVMFPMYAMMVIVQSILGFIAYARMGKVVEE